MHRLKINNKEIEHLKKSLEEQERTNSIEKDNLTKRMQEGLDKLKKAFYKDKDKMERKLREANIHVFNFYIYK